MPSMSVYNENLVPGGGRVITYAGDSAAYDLQPGSTMDVATVLGIGQGAGEFCAKDLTFIIVDTFPKVGAFDSVIIENGDGTNYYRLIAKLNGSVEFTWESATHKAIFTAVPGSIISGSALEYATKTQMVAFVLSNNGQDGQFYIGNLVDADLSKIITTAVIV